MNNSLVRLLARYWFVIAIITALVTGASILADNRRPKGVTATFTATVMGSQAASLDSHLVVQADPLTSVKLLADTATAWLQQPANTQSIFSQASVTPVDDSISALTKFYKVTETGGAVLSIRFDLPSRDDATKMVGATKNFLNQEAASTDNSGIVPRTTFQYSDAIIQTTSSAVPIVPIAGAVIGFIFAVIIVALTDRRR